jgi:RPA family protein
MLKELNGAKYIRGEVGKHASYASTPGGKQVSRAYVWGIVIDIEKHENVVNVHINDLSGMARIKAFGEHMRLLKDVQKGDAVKVIGKVREDDAGLYIMAEGIQRLSFPEEALARANVMEGMLNKPEKIAGIHTKQTEEVSSYPHVEKKVI